MILVAGSANLDFVVRAPHIPRPGETVLGREFKTYPGGKGANQAVACARTGGVPTQLLVALGDDACASPIEASLREAGVALNVVRVAGHPTGTAFICVSDDAENAITVAPGANQCLQAPHLPPLTGVTHLLMQLEIPLATVTAYAQAARQQGVTVVLNAAPAPAHGLPAALLDCVDILIVNEGELATVCQHTGTVAHRLKHLNAPTVVVMLGRKGCIARSQGAFYLQPAFRVNAIDTTAAGDSFCGSLVAALSQGSDLPNALLRASAAGALACLQRGAQVSIPTAHDVTHFLAQQTSPDAAALKNLSAFCGLADTTPA